MLKVNIIAHGCRREEMISTLHDIGLVQIQDLKERLEQPRWAEILREEDTEGTSELDHQFAGIRYALDFVSRFETTTQNLIESFFSPRVAVDPQDYREAVDTFDFAIVDRCRELDAELTRLKNEEAHLYSMYEELFPWESLDIPLEDLKTAHTVGQLGIIPMERSESFKQIAATNPYSYVAVVNETNKEKYVIIIFLKSESEEIFGKLRAVEFSPVSFEGLKGFVTDQLEQILSSIEKTKEEREKVEEKCRELLKDQLRLMIVYDHITSTKAKKEVKENFVRTDTIFVMEGWIPKRDVPALHEGLSHIKEVEILTVEPEEGEDVPVEIHNTGRIMRPFELVTRIYGLPHYLEVDPTQFLAPFFLVFFGLCLSDVFYGILLISLSIFCLKKVKMGPDGNLLFKLLIITGIMTVIFGFLTGSWFGNLTEYAPGSLAITETMRQKLTLLNPIENPLGMLGIVLLMGLVHVCFGIFIKMYINIRDGLYLDAVFDQGLWLLLLPFGTLMVLKTMFEVNIPAYTAVTYVVLGCLIGLVLTQGRYQKAGNIVTSLLKKFFVGILSIYNIFGYLGDVLSYSRVLALGLATGAIAIVFNQIISMVVKAPYVGILFGIILFIILHMFNLIINSLGAFIHPGRLQYVEFFSKFLEGGGEDFKPFQFDSKYIKIKEI
ncbi:MAG: V-type ATP synthase subunit I [Theionarchaea archaeon]|nr:V-type ATP synthase subunit I [Theionarchaea archaeon]